MSADNGVRAVLESELATWQAAIGKRRVQQAMADAEVLRRFALAAGLAPEVELRTPLLGHWALFLDAVPDEGIGADGHPLRGDFLPDVHLPRRMFASAHLEFRQSLQIGKTTECVSTVTAVTHKRGQSGDLVFVNVQREVGQQGRTCVAELQTIVYRAAGERIDPIEPVAIERPQQECWTPSPVQLFRFSAVTFNSHRIHYDSPYARDVEAYPDLVVHGPYTAVRLLDYACRSVGRSAASFRFRGLMPLFVSQPIRLCAGDGPGNFVAIRCDGATAVTAQIEFL